MLTTLKNYRNFHIGLKVMKLTNEINMGYHMKKLVLFCLVSGLVFLAFAQRTEVKTDVLKNKIDAGAHFSSMFNTAEVPVGETNITIPYAKYYLETIQEEKNKFYLTGEMGYKMHKMTIDGKAPEDGDQFGMTFYLDLQPEIKLIIPNEVMEKLGKPSSKSSDGWSESGEWVGDSNAETVNKWFMSIGLPIYYANITPQIDTLDTFSETLVDLTFKLGYDDKKEDIKKLSPWAKFEKGLLAYGLFEYRVSESNEYMENLRKGENIEMPMRFGLTSEYAHDLDNLNAMLKGFLTLKYQMEAESWRVFPWEYTGRGYKGSYIDLSYGIEYVQDFSGNLNLFSRIKYNTWQLSDDPYDNSINALYFDSQLNYYPIKEVNVFGGMNIIVHLREKDKEPEFKFSLGGVYTLDFLNMGGDPNDFYDF